VVEQRADHRSRLAMTKTQGDRADAGADDYITKPFGMVELLLIRCAATRT
jgi:DNA-binding response OmpR family regulator